MKLHGNAALSLKARARMVGQVVELPMVREAALLVHGPALHAEARGSTLEAALLKATRGLEHQVEARRLRHLERGKSQLQLSAISGRWTHPQAGRRA